MDIKSKVGNFLIVGFDGKVITSHLKRLIHEHHIGSVILFTRNIGSVEEVAMLTASLQKEAKEAGYEYPLLICIDQENGIVRRITEGITELPGAMTTAATNDTQNAYDVGKQTALELKTLGINWNLAPTVDVNNNKQNPVINVRSFGEDPELVSQFAIESMKGMQSENLITAIKHFPGHGDTETDSHLEIPVVDHSLERLESIELYPFKRCIDEGADVILSSHVYFPAIESKEGTPATNSRKVITDLLREQMGFNGLVITDCMEMKAISESTGTPLGAVEALKAGIDMVMISHTESLQLETIEKINDSIDSGYLDEYELQEKIARINHIRQKYLCWEDATIDPAKVKGIHLPINKTLSKRIYDLSTTVVENDGIIPLVEGNKRTIMIEQGFMDVLGVEDVEKNSSPFHKQTLHVDSNIDSLVIPKEISVDVENKLLEKVGQYEVLILLVSTIRDDSEQSVFLQKLLTLNKSIILVATRSPYILSELPTVNAKIAMYESTESAFQSALEVIYGKQIATGILPVTI